MTMRALIGVVLVLLAAVPGAAQQKPVMSDQETLIQMERDWDAAFQTRDVATIANLLADEFIATYSDGSRGDKAKELSIAATFNQQVDSRRLEDFIVKVYGDTAVVWMTQHLVGPVQGRPTEITYQYVDMWVLRDGRWQCVASQSTKVTAQAP
jgi:ketosteroid isomerase-like protein